MHKSVILERSGGKFFILLASHECLCGIGLSFQKISPVVSVLDISENVSLRVLLQSFTEKFPLTLELYIEITVQLQAITRQVLPRNKSGGFLFFETI